MKRGESLSLKDAEIDLSGFLSGSNLSNKLKDLAAENRDFGETCGRLYSRCLARNRIFTNDCRKILKSL